MASRQPEEGKTVYVSTQQTPGATPAKDGPVFVIEHGGKFYLTKAVWGYDPARRDVPARVAQGVRDIADFFEEEARRQPPLRGVHVPPDRHRVMLCESSDF